MLASFYNPEVGLPLLLFNSKPKDPDGPGVSPTWCGTPAPTLKHNPQLLDTGRQCLLPGQHPTCLSHAVSATSHKRLSSRQQRESEAGGQKETQGRDGENESRAQKAQLASLY